MGIYRRLIPQLGGEAVPFIFTVSVTAGQSFTLPLVTFGGLQPNIIVDWGDGDESEVTSVTDSDRIHTYVSTGVYDISIFGFMPGFKVNNNSSIRNLITDIVDFGRTGLRTLDFFGCSNITSIPASNTMEVGYRGFNSMISFSGFMRGTGITTIPSDIFSSSPLATTFSDIFSFTSITSIPSGLFDNNTQATSFGSAFSGCTLLNTYPSNLFDNNTLVFNFNSTFRNCVALTLPLQFTNNTSVTIFDNLYNMPSTSNAMSGTAPTLWLRSPTPSGTAAFRNCTGLDDDQFAEIPSNFK
jgi:hypothetical protein